MTLFFIGLGIGDEKDVTLKGLGAIKKCSKVYLEGYTSILNCSLPDLEKLYGKRIIIADRELVEREGDSIVGEAKKSNICFLVVGDPFCATTHQDLRLRAFEKGANVEVIHNASIISAIGEIGLDVYKYGRVTTIPFHNENVKSPVEVYLQNSKMGLHTLFLFDIDPGKNRYMKVGKAIDYLLKTGLKGNIKAVGISGLGTGNQDVKFGRMDELKAYEFRAVPQCMVIPGKLHFMEEECLKQQGL